MLDNVCGRNNSFCHDILTADVAIRSWRESRFRFNAVLFSQINALCHEE